MFNKADLVRFTIMALGLIALFSNVGVTPFDIALADQRVTDYTNGRN